jgi:hypothetical protein
MTIYPLPPQELDDKTLSRQIKNIAQALCNVHWLQLDCDIAKGIDINYICIPLDENNRDNLFTQWASTCLAKYLKLVEMGMDACNEWIFRFINKGKVYNPHKLQSVIEWARDNVPELPCNQTDYSLPSDSFIYDVYQIPGYTTPFPLVMPDKYKNRPFEKYSKEYPIIESYRNYYRARLNRRLKCKECKGRGGYEIFEGEPHSWAECIESDCLEGFLYEKFGEHTGVIYKRLNPKWTRRQKPEWINDL